MTQAGSGNRGASFERKRTPLKRRAAPQAPGPGMIDTACHGFVARAALAAFEAGAGFSGARVDLNSAASGHQREPEPIHLSCQRDAPHRSSDEVKETGARIVPAPAAHNCTMGHDARRRRGIQDIVAVRRRWLMKFFPLLRLRHAATAEILPDRRRARSPRPARSRR